MSQKIKISVVIILAFFTAASLLLFSLPGLASTFGISFNAANTIIDIAAGSGSIWAILAVVGGSFGWGIALLAAAKSLIKHYGKNLARAHGKKSKDPFFN